MRNGIAVLIGGLVGLGLVPAAHGEEVVVYTALDQMFSEPILNAFEAKTGIRVRAAYDLEASKTTGLVNRILAERARPRCDVFWNNEVAQTIVLKERGVLARYRSPSAAAIPEAFKDAEGYWTGFAARARVIIYNTELVDSPPTSVRDLTKPEWKGQVAIALPLFGTTATHVAALFAQWGPDPAKAFLRGLIANDAAVLPGNAAVRDLVARGQYRVGLTDTDDAYVAELDGLPAKWLLPDQEPGGVGTLLIPNAVSLIEGAPNEVNGQKLIDYLLSPEVEARLAASSSLQMPLNPEVEAPPHVPRAADVHTPDITFEEIAVHMADSAAFVRETFVK